MKKTIAILLFFIGCMLYAETGYRGHEWYSLSSTFPRTGREKNEQPGWMKTIIYQKEILGETTFLFYGFSFEYEEFINAGYIIPIEKHYDLVAELYPTKYNIYKINLGDYANLEEQIEEAKRNDDDYKNYGEKEEYHFFYDQLSWFALMIEQYGIEEIQENPNATVIIYDYNNDTRLYLFDGAIKGKTVAVYVPHEQNY